MAISLVRAQINGSWVNLTYDSTSKTYKGTLTAPGSTSFNREGGYYDVTVEATNTAGTKTTVNGSDLADLQLVVRETVKPVITVVSPAAGAYVTNNKQPIVFNITDEVGGSGVMYGEVGIKVDGTAVSPANIVNATEWVAITNGYKVTYTPPSALADGNHTIVIDARDNDGNQANTVTTTFKVDTVPPTLNVTAPVNNMATNAAALTVEGTTNDSTSSPVTITMTLNGASQGSVTVASNGSFSKTVTLAEGSNTLVITAKDAAGKTSSVTRTVTLDTTTPVIQSVVITPNPVNTGGTVSISVTIV